MRALDIKVFRDLGRMRSQMFAIALVIAAGVAVFVSMRTTMKSLREARATWYSEQSFAHVFAGLTRAPEQVARELRSLAGVESLETRVEGWCTLEIPGLVEAATGHIVSLPESGPGAVNRVYLLRGRLPEADDEVLVGEAFFVAQHEKLGSTLSALIAGRQANLKMVGVALSPEFTYSVGPGQMFPDDRRFGVFWMPRKPLAALLDLEGAFNSVALRTHSGAIEHEVLDRVDDILKPYGGVGAIPRALQTSAFFLDNELSQLSTFAVLVPSLFLAVAAFLLNIVFGRLIASQRGDIAALKAFGYRDTEVGVHYGKLLVVIVLVGWLLGVALGAWLGASMTEQYGQYYRFPKLAYHLGGADPTIALLVTLAGALGGTWAALARTVSMPPAEAMRPPSPPVYRRTLLERLGLDRFLAMPVRMVLREFERKPLRSLLSVLGVVMATGLSVVMSSGRDSMDRMLEVQFGRMQREDVHLTLREPRDLQVLSSLSHLPGVERVEGYRGVPVKLTAGTVHRNTSILGLPRDGVMQRLLDADYQPIAIPEHGLVLARKLSQILGIGVGDKVEVEVLDGRRQHAELPITRVADTLIGTSAYMDRAALCRFLGEGETINGATMLVDDDRLVELHAVVKRTPLISGVSAKQTILRQIRDILEQNMGTFLMVSVFFSLVMAFGVLYNTVRITLAERSRELATMRVLGFREPEVAWILVGEMALVLVIGIPLGLWVGYGLAALLISSPGFDTEQFRLPLVVSTATYGTAMLAVLVSGLVSGGNARRKLARMDLVEVLKTRD